MALHEQHHPMAKTWLQRAKQLNPTNSTVAYAIESAASFPHAASH